MTAPMFPRQTKEIHMQTPARRKSVKGSTILFVVLLMLAIVVGYYALMGWLIVSIIGWFGPKLAIWQGGLIALVLGMLTGSSVKATVK